MTAAINLVNTIAGNAIIGSIATKTLDSLVSQKFSQKNDKKKWIREKTLNLFSDLSSEVLEITCENLEEKQKKVRELTSKINLLIDNNNLKINLKNYSFILNEYHCYKNDINLDYINEELVSNLKLHMQKM